MKTAAFGFRKVVVGFGALAIPVQGRNIINHSRKNGPAISTVLTKDFSKAFEYHQNLFAVTFVVSLSAGKC
jgi:hypothetical protein